MPGEPAPLHTCHQATVAYALVDMGKVWSVHHDRRTAYRLANETNVIPDVVPVWVRAEGTVVGYAD